MRQWKNYDFGDVLFSDEKKWVLVVKKNAWGWRPANGQYNSKYTPPRKQMGGGSLMVWGCMSKDEVFPPGLHWHYHEWGAIQGDY